MTQQHQQALAGIFETLDLATQNDEQFKALVRLARGTGDFSDAAVLMAMPGMQAFFRAATAALWDDAVST